MFLDLINTISYELDLFKLDFHFQFSKGKSKFSSFLGTFFSLFVFGILFFFFAQSDMIQRTNPSVISQTIPKISSPQLKVNQSNFNIIFGIADQNLTSYHFDDSLVNVKIFGIKFIESSNKMKNNVLYSEFDYHPCSEKDMEHNYFGLTGFKDSYCLSNFEWEIEGSFFPLK